MKRQSAVNSYVLSEYREMTKSQSGITSTVAKDTLQLLKSVSSATVQVIPLVNKLCQLMRVIPLSKDSVLGLSGRHV